MFSGSLTTVSFRFAPGSHLAEQPETVCAQSLIAVVVVVVVDVAVVVVVAVVLVVGQRPSPG